MSGSRTERACLLQVVYERLPPASLAIPTTSHHSIA
jgi:hypothetical protein